LGVIADLERARVELRSRRFGRSLEILAETGSTNDDARAALERGALDGHTIVADRQSAGRGARGRVWSSPGGSDLYFSIVSRAHIDLSRSPPLTLAIGLGVARAIEALAQREARVKWPNDVLLGGRKCAGILVEASARGAMLEGAVIGIGIDVNREDFDPELDVIATSMKRERGERFDRATVLARALESVEEEVDRFVASGPASIVDRVGARLAWIGERASSDDVEGLVLGLAPSGALRMRTDDGRVREVVSGTLRASPR
jgi:BirA family transcriptional regulator, biotin operon repressor / biotin---[acetyl-CoA-carboxylase] ligase